MVRSAFTALFLFAVWLLMSGVYKPLVIGLGIFSAILAAYVVRRMDNAADTDRLTINLRPWETVKYTFWLLGEIAKSNIAVTKVIMAGKMPLRQHFFQVPYTQKSDLAQTIFANSITLTPGTISVEVEEDHFWVHALCYDDSDLDALADMDARAAKTEGAA